MSKPIAASPLRLTAPPAVYRQRRARLAAQLTRPLVLFAGHAPARNLPSNAHPFRAGSSYLYFGGPPLENAALFIEPGSDGDAGCTLVRPTWGVEDAIWVGDPLPDEVLVEAAGLERGRLIAPDQLPWLLTGHDAAYLAPPAPETLALAARLELAPASPDERAAIVNLRLVKDEHELAAMRRAAEVTVAAHRAALAAAVPGRREADVAAAFHAVLVAHECQPSFTPIISIRGEIFHGVGHSNLLTEGALLLIDGGAEEPGGYAGDCTRTVPVGGHWSPIQRHLYDTVRRANEAATAAAVPGARWRHVHELAARVICEGLIAAELLRGDPAELAARNAHALFFPHGLGHLIGLDVHDMRDFGDVAGYPPGRSRPTEFGTKFLRFDRDLEPGLTATVEPGIYFNPAIWSCDELVQPLADVVDRRRVDALLRDRFGGIRIEHTICVRAAGGPEILTAGLPTDADQLTMLLGNT